LSTAIDSDVVYCSSTIQLTSTTQSPSNSQTKIADLGTTDNSLAVGYKTAIGTITPIGWSFPEGGYVNHAFAIRPAGIACIAPSDDTQMRSDAATTNYDTQAYFGIGENNTAASTERAWVKPSFTGIPTGKQFNLAYFRITPISDLTTNARTMSMYRCLRDVVSAQTTWNIWKTANNWGTAGASNSTTDYDGAVVMGSMSVTATPVLDVAQTMTLTASELQKLYDGTYTNNGVILSVDTQTNDLIRWYSKDDATAAFHPRFIIQYSSVNTGNFFAAFP
jgi:hypothetical protein